VAALVWRFVSGPWRYERLDGVDHWVPVHAPERLNELLVDFLGQLVRPVGRGGRR
jgi:hypothetical protein